ncbi:hypothetical protein L226DRAFT_576393 [Lentinus tigrinus ALCF2SS1-7]|uniref:uncharacterized protein n=1 Tax=Lentinus tigrinus ALCF2SS1-7 TaxID=1328758 RepID=UPI0011662CFB|nr:hypothetical protein L226DRAFT_576393 [Lentinus tigrinus ALCF2SS1-7]
MFAAGLLIIVLAFFAPLQSLARPAPRSDTLVIRFNVIDPRPYPGTGPRITRCIAGDCPRDLVQRRAHGKGGADGQDANGQDGQDGQDAVGQNGGVAIGGDANGQDAVGQDGGDATGTGTGNNDNQVVSVGGHTIVIQNGQIVSVDGQPVGGSGANGQDGSASGGQAGSAGQGGSASGGQAVAGKGEIGGQDGVATPGKRGVVLP